MRRIINYFIILGILYGGGLLFPENIQIESLSVAFIVALMLFLAMSVLAFLVGTILVGSVVRESVFLTFFSVVSLFAITPMSLLVISSSYDGFAICGFWTYILLGLAIGIFTVAVPTKQS